MKFKSPYTCTRKKPQCYLTRDFQGGTTAGGFNAGQPGTSKNTEPQHAQARASRCLSFQRVIHNETLGLCSRDIRLQGWPKIRVVSFAVQFSVASQTFDREQRVDREGEVREKASLRADYAHWQEQSLRCAEHPLTAANSLQCN